MNDVVMLLLRSEVLLDILALCRLALGERQMLRKEVCRIWWRRWRSHAAVHVVRINHLRLFLLWWLGHRPHVHGDGPVGLDNNLPNLRKNNLTVRSDEIIVTFVDVGTDHIDMKESLLDEFFHSLDSLVLISSKCKIVNIPSKSCTNPRGS